MREVGKKKRKTKEKSRNGKTTAARNSELNFEDSLQQESERNKTFL